MDLRRDQLNDAVRSHPGLIVLFFHADWYGPCRSLASVLEEIKRESEGVLFANIDIDSEIALAMDFNITEIPSLVFLSRGAAVLKMCGMQTKEEILGQIERWK